MGGPPLFDDPVFQRAHIMMLRQLLQLCFVIARLQFPVKGQLGKYMAMKERSNGFQALIQV